MWTGRADQWRTCNRLKFGTSTSAQPKYVIYSRLKVVYIIKKKCSNQPTRPHCVPLSHYMVKLGPIAFLPSPHTSFPFEREAMQEARSGRHNEEVIANDHRRCVVSNLFFPPRAYWFPCFYAVDDQSCCCLRKPNSRHTYKWVGSVREWCVLTV